LSNNEKQVKTNMLDEFEKQLDEICDNYFEENFTLEDSISKIKHLSVTWEHCRFDLKNFGIKTNEIKLIDYPDSLKIYHPAWFANDEGKGCKFTDKSGKINIKFQCIGDGNLRYSLRGNDYRNVLDNSLRNPVYINYTKFTINNEKFIEDEVLTWHNKPIVVNQKCENDEIFDVEINYSNIYHYFPKLRPFVMKLIKTDNDFEKAYDDVKKFIKYEKMRMQLNEIAVESVDLYTFLNDNKLVFDNNFLSSHDLFINTYQNYDNYNKLTQKIDELNTKLSALENKLTDFETNTEKALDSNNVLFNNLYLDYQFTPNRLLNNLQTLCSELLSFVNNICKKHGIDWWLDYGNLLGAIRHGYFIPWDDDMDIGMMRKDYHKFIDVLYDEIKDHGMNNYINVYYRKRQGRNKLINSFVQFFVMDKKRKKVMAGVDVFPYDFLKEYNPEDFGPKYNRAQTQFYRTLNNGSKRSAVYMGLDYEEVIGQYYSSLNLSYEKAKYVIPGVEGSFGYHRNLYEVKALDSEEMFPLKEVDFGNYKFPAPKNSDYYLRQIYGDYLKVPKSIRTHSRVNNFRNIEGINETFEKRIEIFKEVNENF